MKKILLSLLLVLCSISLFSCSSTLENTLEYEEEVTEKEFINQFLVKYTESKVFTAKEKIHIKHVAKAVNTTQIDDEPGVVKVEYVKRKYKIDYVNDVYKMKNFSFYKQSNKFWPTVETRNDKKESDLAEMLVSTKLSYFNLHYQSSDNYKFYIDGDVFTSYCVNDNSNIYYLEIRQYKISKKVAEFSIYHLNKWDEIQHVYADSIKIRAK